ncbi:putative Ig domain-containing protein, partial [Meiothermus sp. CFH 77666]|nr:putative Ig domain-containing protein [Meiothermus sp. CFH 77666]
LVGAPSGVTLSPENISVGSSPTTQTLTISVNQGVNPGTYNLKVRAESVSLRKEADLALTVTAPSPNPPDLPKRGGGGNTILTSP